MDTDRLETDLHRLARASGQRGDGATDHDERRFATEVKRRATRRRRRRDARLVMTGAASVMALVAGLVVAIDVRNEPDPIADRLPGPSVSLPVGDQMLLDAVRSDDIELVDLFLAAGADPDASVRHDITALMVASFRGRTDIVRSLLDAGADMDATNVHGQRAIHAAALADRADVARELLAAGAEPDRLGSGPAMLGKLTPLMTATLFGSAATVEALLDAGADPMLVDATGRPTIAFALGAQDDARHRAIISHFRDAGAVLEHPDGEAPPIRLEDLTITEILEALEAFDRPRATE